MRERLPEVKEVKVRLSLEEAKECLRYLPKELEGIKKKIEEAIAEAEFWDFSRNCPHLQAIPANFHLTGLMEKGWHLYCTHPENKKGREGIWIETSPKVRDEITGPCERQSCPVYEPKRR